VTTPKEGAAQRRPRLLLLSMYPLDRGRWGATTRIAALRDALARRVDLDVISGTPAVRSRQMARYAGRGRLRGLAGIYVENATSLPRPTDITFLATARALRIPVLTYLRDAQQLFPEYYSADTLKRRASRALFRSTTRALMGVSSHVAFPSRGLAAAILRDAERAEAALLLPPGARIADAPPIDPGARSLLFVGGLRYPAHGGSILLEAMDLVRQRGLDLTLICVSRPGEEPSNGPRNWLKLVRAEGPQIDALLPEVLASITPRRSTPYNDLAVPIKVMEYLGYARPVIATDTTETAAIVRGAGAGIVVPDTVEGLAHGITLVAEAPPEQLMAWSEAARQAALANSWDARAARILSVLEVEA
jgi:glycosyltransferase involved in cell wall biosynthesis